MYNVKDGIYGFIIGDALGVPVEFNSRVSLELNPVKNMREFGTHNQPKGTWSDDTSMMLATIDSLINKNGYNLEDSFFDMANNFVLWYKENKYTPNNEVFDIGISTRKALDNYITNKNKLCGGKEILDNGNGSLMRILPLAYYFHALNCTLDKRKEITFEVSSITHANIISKYGCLIYIEFVLNILKNEKNLDLLKIYHDTIYKIEKLLEKENTEDRELVKNAYNRIFIGSIPEESYENIRSSGYIVDTLEAVLWCILNTTNYVEAVLKAVNLGDDTDTIGALTGGIAGIIYKESSIPTDWIQALKRKDYIDELIYTFETKLEEINHSSKIMDLEFLQKTIDDLKNNPNACELTIYNHLSRTSNPGKQLSAFMDYISEKNLYDKGNYLENHKKIKNKDISTMNYNEILTELTFFLRGERFCGGFWYEDFKDGTLLKIVERLKELI